MYSKLLIVPFSSNKCPVEYSNDANVRVAEQSIDPFEGNTAVHPTNPLRSQDAGALPSTQHVESSFTECAALGSTTSRHEADEMGGRSGASESGHSHMSQSDASVPTDITHDVPAAVHDHMPCPASVMPRRSVEVAQGVSPAMGSSGHAGGSAPLTCATDADHHSHHVPWSHEGQRAF